jgi:RecA/RadA recombinase
MWQLLVEPEFAEKMLPHLDAAYFDNPILKRMFIIVYSFFKEFEKPPNLQNKTIHMAISQYQNPNNTIEVDGLSSMLKRIEHWNNRVLNGLENINSGDVIRIATRDFIKQQEYRKIGEYILRKTKEGLMKDPNTVSSIEAWFERIADIGKDNENSIDIFDNIDKVLSKEFRQTTPTGVEFIDAVTGGGLGKSEIGIILTPSGVGKTTLLTKIANTAYEDGKNVLQIIFEDTHEQVQRKHYAIWSGIGLSSMDDNLENVKEIIVKKSKKMLEQGGELTIVKFSQEHTTIKDIRLWMDNYQKKHDIKFDILILDYLDCLEPNTRQSDRNEAELQIIKSFEALAGDYNIPAWSAIQSNRTGFGSEFIEAHQSGGSIKRIQKSHFFMSVARGIEQLNTVFANVAILKARFARDGQRFENVIFNNDTLEIRIEDDKFKQMALNRGKKHHDSKDIDKLVSSTNELHSRICQTMDNNDAANDAANDAVKDAVIDDLRKRVLSKNNETPKIVKEESTEPLGIDAQEEISKIMKEESTEPLGIDAQELIDTKKTENSDNENQDKISIDKIKLDSIDLNSLENKESDYHKILIERRENQNVMKD